MNGSADNEAEDEDPIVKEIPIFLSKSLAENLYLFQYPVRPAHMTYDSASIIASRIKPKQQQVELTVVIDSSTSNYDASKGEQLALNADGSNKTNKDLDSILYPSGIMDKQVLSSKRSVTEPSRYAVGILGSDEFHITPLNGVVSLRPDLAYLDKSDKTAKSEGRLESTDVDDPSAADEVKAVTVRFARGDSDAAKKRMEKSFEYQKKKAEEEPWIATRFHPLKSTKWEEESQKLFCRRMDEEILSLSQTPKEYLTDLTE